MRETTGATTVDVSKGSANGLDYVVGRDRLLTTWARQLGRHRHAQAGHAGPLSSSTMIRTALGPTQCRIWP